MRIGLEDARGAFTKHRNAGLYGVYMEAAVEYHRGRTERNLVFRLT